LKNLLLTSSIGLLLALAASAQSNGKVGVINLQNAIAGTKDGQKASGDLQKKFEPKRVDMERRQTEIQRLQDQLSKATTDTERARLNREIEQKTKSLNRDREDARAELDQEEQRIVNDLGSKVVAASEKYARDHGYTWIMDISSQQTPVVYFSETIDITKDVIDLYDKGGAPASTAGAAPAKPVVPPAKPATPSK